MSSAHGAKVFKVTSSYHSARTRGSTALGSDAIRTIRTGGEGLEKAETEGYGYPASRREPKSQNTLPDSLC